MTDEAEQSKQLVITKDTKIPMSLAIGFVIACFSFHQYIAAQFDVLRETLSSVNHKLEKLEATVSGGWGAQDMKVWEGELARGNPTIKVPDTWSVIRRGSSTARE